MRNCINQLPHLPRVEGQIEQVGDPDPSQVRVPVGQSGERIPRALQVRFLDKVEHVTAYGLIAGFFLLSLKRPVRPAVPLIGLAILAALGALDETTQPLVERTCDLWDFASDLVGITIPCVISGIARLWRVRTVPS